jgi:hypothetical protein
MDKEEEEEEEKEYKFKTQLIVRRFVRVIDYNKQKKKKKPIMGFAQMVIKNLGYVI